MCHIYLETIIVVKEKKNCERDLYWKLVHINLDLLFKVVVLDYGKSLRCHTMYKGLTYITEGVLEGVYYYKVFGRCEVLGLHTAFCKETNAMMSLSNITLGKKVLK